MAERDTHVSMTTEVCGWEKGWLTHSGCGWFPFLALSGVSVAFSEQIELSVVVFNFVWDLG